MRLLSDFFVDELVVESSYIFAGFETYLPGISQDAFVLGDNAGKTRRLYGAADNFLYFLACAMNALNVTGCPNFVHDAGQDENCSNTKGGTACKA